MLKAVCVKFYSGDNFKFLGKISGKRKEGTLS